MTRKYTILFCIMMALAAVHSSCTRNLDLPDIKADAKIVLMGELIAGQAVYLRAGKSLPISSGSPMQFELLRDLNMTLSDGSGLYTIPGQEDSLSGSNHTIPFTISRLVESGKTYTITATHGSMGQATAIVYVPDPVNATVLDTATATYNSIAVLKIKVQISNPASADNYYVIESVKQKTSVSDSFFYNGYWLSIVHNRKFYTNVKALGPVVEKHDTVLHNEFYRKKIYTNDKSTENAIDGGINAAHNRILLNGARFPGAVYTTEVYVQKSDVVDSVSGNSFLYIKSITPEYFNYLKYYEQFDGTNTFNNFINPVKLTGNVSNGAGMIGGVSVVRFSFP